MPLCSSFHSASYKSALSLIFLVCLSGQGASASVNDDLNIDLPRIGVEDTIELEADYLVYYSLLRRADASGNVQLGFKNMVLSADQVLFDLATESLVASGNVRVDYGARTLLAERLSLILDSEYAEVQKWLLTITDPADQSLRLHLAADRMERMADNIYLVEKLSFSPCDASEGEPAWSVSARRARIVPGEGAWLFGSFFRIRNAPIIPLPVFYLPLGDRRSGFLSPRFGFSGRNGIRTALPFYLTLGQSWDLTLTGGWYGGVDTWDDLQRPGVRGFDQDLELRWAPAPRIAGKLVVNHLYDLHYDNTDPETDHRGSRWTIKANHTGRFDTKGFGNAGHGFHANINLLSDAALAGDLQPTLEQAQRGYLRSNMRTHYTHGDNFILESGSRWIQDIRKRLLGTNITNRRIMPLYGDEAPATAQLLPYFYAGTGRLPLLAQSGGNLELRASSWQRPFGDAEKTSFYHLNTGGEISQPVSGDFLSGRISFAYRADAWMTDDDFLSRAYPILNALLNTGFERRFTNNTHRIRPGLSWRMVPYVSGGAPETFFDIFERAIPDEGLHQLVADISNQLWAGRRRILDVNLSQGVDFNTYRLSELEMDFYFSPGSMPHVFEANFGWNWDAGTFSWLTGAARIIGYEGSSIRTRWIWVSPDGAGGMASAFDELFSSGALAPAPLQAMDSPVNELVLSLNPPRLLGLGLRYEVKMEIVDTPRPPQHRLRLDFGESRGCWRGSMTATWPPGAEFPEIFLSMELSGIGSVATGPRGIQ